MTQQRRTEIAALVRKHGVVRVGELADQFAVSEVTIRNDLECLERDGHLTRDHGGAITKGDTKRVTSLLRVDERAAQHVDEKRRIARAAAQFVSPGDTIILDAGTTVVELARLVAGVSPLTIVTNAVNVALEIGTTSDARLILLGGTFNRESSSTVGALTEHNLTELVVQKLFLGTQAMDLENGLTDSTSEIAQVKRAMIRAAKQVILLTDSSKWSHAGFIKVVPLTKIDTIITDRNLPAEACAAIRNLGIELILA
jgi:DeoR/GlpR family transcriptional regulator of sugar metabolism